MTLLSLFIPMMGAGVLALVVTASHRRLPPVLAARIGVASVAVVCLAVVPSLWILGLQVMAHAPIVGHGARWCSMTLGLHDHVTAWLTVPALALAVIGSVRAARVLWSHRRLAVHQPGEIEIADDPRPYAVSLPGRGERIVVSRGLVDLLSDDEFDVVLAHERTHARFRHDRMLLVAGLAQAVCPLLRPLTRRLRFSLERWADEAAARRCGDRRRVARTLAKVALAADAPQGVQVGVAGFTGLGVSARAEAMLASPPEPPSSVLLAGLFAGVVATAVLALVQLHHLGGMVAALCLA